MNICNFTSKRGTKCKRCTTNNFQQCDKHLSHNKIKTLNENIYKNINLVYEKRDIENHKHLGNFCDCFKMLNNFEKKYNNIEYLNIILENNKIIKITKHDTEQSKKLYLSCEGNFEIFNSNILYKKDLKTKISGNYLTSLREYYMNKECYIFNLINNQNRFKIFYLHINRINLPYGHGNFLIYDKHFNTIYNFDPNGKVATYEINIQLKSLFEEKYSVKYIRFYEFLNNKYNQFGPQAISKSYEFSKNNKTCLYWCFCIMNVIMQNYKNNILNNIKIDTFMNLFYKKLENSSTYSCYINSFICEMRRSKKSLIIIAKDKIY
jgi:hypothetical protein